MKQYIKQRIQTLFGLGFVETIPSLQLQRSLSSQSLGKYWKFNTQANPCLPWELLQTFNVLNWSTRAVKLQSWISPKNELLLVSCAPRVLARSVLVSVAPLVAKIGFFWTWTHDARVISSFPWPVSLGCSRYIVLKTSTHRHHHPHSVATIPGQPE